MPIQNSSKTFSSNTYTFISLQPLKKNPKYNSTPPSHHKKVATLIQKLPNPPTSNLKHYFAKKLTVAEPKEKNNKKIQQYTLAFIKKNIINGLKVSWKLPPIPPFG